MSNKKRIEYIQIRVASCNSHCEVKTQFGAHNGQITSNYELIWYGRPNTNKSSNYGYQQDESTARWHLKSPWSLSCSSLHLILVTKRSRSWSWMTPDCSLPIGPSIPEMGLFQNLTLKIQGQGHSQGQTWWLHLLLRICFHFMAIGPYLVDGLRYGKFHIWPENL